MEPQILFEDQDLVVLNKPSGMTVNKADTTRNETTVQDWVEKNISLDIPIGIIPEKTETGDYNPEYEFKNRGGIVHRLDKETSGILLVAKNPKSFAKLKEQFMTRQVKKVYLALAHGEIAPRNGEINVPIGRLEFNRMRFGAVAGGREARTLYQVLAVKQMTIGKKKEKVSLVELYPQTGRTHQIRVHLKHINRPIVSDELYAGRKVARDDRKLLSRLFLHAKGISFIHPTTEKQIDFVAPLTSDLQGFLDTLQD
ncbi:MAG TPA: RluA family pseudouridine synthase [Patescibacteria group bacterium]